MPSSDQNHCFDEWFRLQRKLFADSWRDDLRRHRTRHLFRGLSRSDYRLTTTLQRLGSPVEKIEPVMLRQFKKYAHREVEERDSIWHTLSIAQHHGLPTRLLDWTLSPFVAMHFATDNSEDIDRDGAIWMVDFFRVHECLPERLGALLREKGVNAFATDELSELVDSLEELKELEESREFMLFFEPPSIE